MFSLAGYFVWLDQEELGEMVLVMKNLILRSQLILALVLYVKAS